GAVGGGVVIEHPAPRGLTEAGGALRRHVAQERDHLVARARYQDFLSRREKVLESLPVVTDDRDAAGGGLKEADARGMPRRDHGRGREVEREVERIVERPPTIIPRDEGAAFDVVRPANDGRV